VSDKPELSLTFLYNSITDIQGVIRALDTKLNYLLVILVLPLTKLGSINRILYETYCKSLSYLALHYLVPLIIIIFIASWIFAFVLAMLGIIGIDNPVAHVSGSSPKGTFYGGYLYKTVFYDTLFNRSIQSQDNIENHIKAIPEDKEAIKQELGFEQMKLVYIRTIKMARHKYAFIFGLIWIVSGAVIWVAFLAL
jgi:hypothetical protein